MMWLKASQTGERYRYPGIRSPKVSKQVQPKENVTKLHYNQAIKNQRQRENFERSKRKNNQHIQGNLHKTISKFISRNHMCQKRMNDIFKVLKTTTKLTLKIYIPNKAVF